MTRRPKLSLEPGRQIRHEPPKGFGPTDRTDPPDSEPSSNEHAEVKTQDPPATKRDAESGDIHIPKAPSPQADPSTKQYSPPQAPPIKQTSGLSRATAVKVLLAVGIAALSILLLKRRFF